MTGRITFEQARRIAREFLCSDLPVSLFDSPYVLEVLIGSTRPDLFERLAPEYVKLAASDREWWNAVNWIAGELVARGLPLPGALAEFVVRVLKGEAQPPPKRRGCSRFKNYHRNLMIWWAVSTIVDGGLPATRNEVSETHSACDAVAVEWGLSYHGVVSAWQDMRAQLRDRDARIKGASDELPV